ncbi:MAG: ABC transporter permease [Clostridia bacterium]|nr:ABC transporter permease [Clostridia bacterium]
MGKYILKRIGYVFLVLIILSILMFLLYNAIPSDRAYSEAREAAQLLPKSTPEEVKEKFRETEYTRLQVKYGTETKNLVVRYLRWIGVYPKALYIESTNTVDPTGGDFDGLFQGNFGYSYTNNKPVIELIKEPMKNTIFINIFATILALGITIPLGIRCAVKRGKKLDTVVQVGTIIGYSLPTFLIAILFVWLFVAVLKVFPASGMKTPGAAYTGIRAFFDKMYYLALPLIVMTFSSLGGMTRYVRASMIEALSMDCIKTARAKGLREKVVIYSHAWRNALIPIVTLVVGWFLSIFSGSLIIEQMFALNGMGKLLIEGLQTQDYDVVLLMQMFYVLISLFGNLLIDIIYGFVDPRVRVNK